MDSFKNNMNRAQEIEKIPMFEVYMTEVLFMAEDMKRCHYIGSLMHALCSDQFSKTLNSNVFKWAPFYMSVMIFNHGRIQKYT